MIEPPQIIHIKPQLTAAIHLMIPKDQIREVMRPALTELMSALASQGIKPAGAWFDHHFKIDDDSWDFEVCVPVTAPVEAAGRVQPGQWPAMKVARTIFHGDYEGLFEAWEEFSIWIVANGHSPAQDLYQWYVIGPEASSDPAQWRTELFRPLI